MRPFRQVAKAELCIDNRRDYQVVAIQFHHKFHRDPRMQSWQGHIVGGHLTHVLGAAMQRAIRTCLGSRKSFDTAAQSSRTVVRRTLLVIAHRIDTIMDCDQLLVLSHGHLVECGSPGKLVAKDGGVFAGLVAAAAAGGMQAR